MMGFDCESFDKILDKFAPIFSGHTPFDKSGFIVEFEYISGRKREVQPADCLGLVLVWTRTRGPLNVLQLVFGLTYTNLSVYLRFGFRLIVETFHDDPLARVSIPSTETINEYKAAFGARHSLLDDCWATMDGLKLYLQQSGNFEIQERFYNGWTHDHYVTSVFCFCPDGTIPIAFFNVPGSVQEYMTSSRQCLRQPGGNAASTQHLAALQGTTSLNQVRTFWDLRRQHVMSKIVNIN